MRLTCALSSNITSSPPARPSGLRQVARVHTLKTMLVTILIGFFVGVIARWIKPGARAMGWIMTSLLGIGGAVVATWLGQTLGWYERGDHAGFLASVGGAIVVLIAYEAIKPRLVRAHPPDERARPPNH